jgi:flotillin
VVDKLISSLPEIVRAMAAPLSNVDKITIVSTGNGTTAGASKITGDMAAIAAQVPALFEALSGMSMSELFSKVKQIGDNTPKPAPELPSGNDPAGGKAKAAAKS